MLHSRRPLMRGSEGPTENEPDRNDSLLSATFIQSLGYDTPVRGSAFQNTSNIVSRRLSLGALEQNVWMTTVLRRLEICGRRHVF